MEKTKFGLAVNWAAAILFAVAFFAGYVPAIIIAGYFLIAESCVWLKRMSAKCLVIMLVFSAVSFVLGFLPGIFMDLASYGSILYNIFKYIDYVNTIIIQLLKIAAFVFMIILSLKKSEARIPLLDNILDKCFPADTDAQE